MIICILAVEQYETIFRNRKHGVRALLRIFEVKCGSKPIHQKCRSQRMNEKKKKPQKTSSPPAHTICIYQDSKLIAFLIQWYPRTMDTQLRHKSKKSENLGGCGRQNVLRPYLKIWEWEWIFGHAVKAVSSPASVVRVSNLLSCLSQMFTYLLNIPILKMSFTYQ